METNGDNLAFTSDVSDYEMHQTFAYTDYSLGPYAEGLTIIIIIIIIISCHRPSLPGTSLEQTVTPTAQASSFTLQYFPYYV
jgi:hypothetical protein